MMMMMMGCMGWKLTNFTFTQSDLIAYAMAEYHLMDPYASASVLRVSQNGK